MTEDRMESNEQFIYRLITGRFENEWQRALELNKKAGSLIGAIGIIIVLQVGLGIPVLLDAGTSSYFIMSMILIASMLLSLTAFLYGLKAYSLKRWSWGPEIATLLESADLSESRRAKLLRDTIAEFIDAIGKNKKSNDQKADDIQVTFYYLAAGLFAFFAFSVCILIL